MDQTQCMFDLQEILSEYWFFFQMWENIAVTNATMLKNQLNASNTNPKDKRLDDWIIFTIKC